MWLQLKQQSEISSRKQIVPGLVKSIPGVCLFLCFNTKGFINFYTALVNHFLHNKKLSFAWFSIFFMVDKDY